MSLILVLRRLKNRCCPDILLRTSLRGGWLSWPALKLYERVRRSRRSFKVLPVAWLDSTEREGALLRAGGETIVYGPHVCGRQQATGEANVPDVRFFVFRNATVSAESSSVVSGGTVLIESAGAPDRHAHDYAAAHILAHDAKNAIICVDPGRKVSRGIFLGGNGAWNYYHWIVELLPKLELVMCLPEKMQRFPLLVSEAVLGTPALREALEMFSRSLPQPEIIPLKSGCSYSVEKLVYINSPNTLPFNLRSGFPFKLAYSSLDPQAIGYLRSVAFDALASSSLGPATHKRVFLARKNNRRNYNQDSILELLHGYGFFAVFMEELPFLEQVRLINGAHFIVGPTGAAWTNLIFSGAGVKALCWMAEETGDFSVYSNIAGMVGADLRYIMYNSGALSVGELYSRDYVVDPQAIADGLSELGLHPA